MSTEGPIGPEPPRAGTQNVVIDDETREPVAVEVVPEAAAWIARQDAATLDVQVATAKHYPRSVQSFQSELTAWCTLSQSVADECFFALPRDGKKIFGPSVRFAEMVLAAYGNMVVETQIVEEGKKFVMVMATCRDLQRNTATRAQVRRGILNRQSKRYKADMIENTISAASAIARRNAIFQAVPRALWMPIWEEARRVARGDEATFEQRRREITKGLRDAGCNMENVKHFLGGRDNKDITADDLILLRLRLREITERTTTPEAAFPSPIPDTPEDGASAVAAKDALDNALSGRVAETQDETGGFDEPEPEVDPETGEVIPTEAELARQRREEG